MAFRSSRPWIAPTAASTGSSGVVCCGCGAGGTDAATGASVCWRCSSPPPGRAFPPSRSPGCGRLSTSSGPAVLQSGSDGSGCSAAFQEPSHLTPTVLPAVPSTASKAFSQALPHICTTSLICSPTASNASLRSPTSSVMPKSPTVTPRTSARATCPRGVLPPENSSWLLKYTKELCRRTKYFSSVPFFFTCESGPWQRTEGRASSEDSSSFSRPAPAFSTVCSTAAEPKSGTSNAESL
mmetsp:Transcript_36159/g.104028  ORF Transcript_36159/g.104028 Transcript_36159/m.104028 type:complete len:239 (-) Transcript_36159:337-1053(-)